MRVHALTLAALVLLAPALALLSPPARALDPERPFNVTVASVTDRHFAVSFLTGENTTAWLRYGADPAALTEVAYDDRNPGVLGDFATRAHHFVVGDLTENATEPELLPDTTYYFRIVAQNVTYGNYNGFAVPGAPPWAVRTSAVGDNTDFVLFMAITRFSFGNSTSDVLVYARLRNATTNETSAWLSTVAYDFPPFTHGFVAFPLSEARSGTGQRFGFKFGDVVELRANGGPLAVGANETELILTYFPWGELYPYVGPVFLDLVPNPPPQLEFTAPAPRASAGNQDFEGTWVASEPWDAAEITLYRDDDRDAGNGAVLLAEHVAEDLGPGTFRLDLSGFPEGTLLWIRGDIDDGVNPPVTVYSGVPVEVDRTPPAPIDDLAASPGIDDGSVDLRWNATGDDGAGGIVVGYDIRVSTNPITVGNVDAATPVPNGLLPRASGEPEGLTVTGLDPGSRYYFVVRATDGANLGPLSNVASANAQEDLGDPSAVDDLRGSGGPDSGDVLLLWTAPGDDIVDGVPVGRATRYDLRYSDAPISVPNWDAATRAPDPPAPAPAGTAQTFLLSGLPPGVRHYFGIEAFDEAGNPSGLSNLAAVTPTVDPAPPAAVLDLWAVPGRGEGEVDLSWTAVGDDADAGEAAAYVVGWSLEDLDEAAWGGVRTLRVDRGEPQGTPLNATVGDLRPTWEYKFAVRAIDDGGNLGPLSNVVVASPYTGATLPVLSSPVEGQIYPATEPVLFDASGTRDADNELEYVWSLRGRGALCGECGARFEERLPPGEYTLQLWIVNANDSADRVYLEANFTVREPETVGGIAGVDAPLLLAGAVGAVALLNVVLIARRARARRARSLRRPRPPRPRPPPGPGS